MTDDEMGHASSVNEQLRQAEENDEIPASSADRSSLRLIVDGEHLNSNNPIDYLVMLLLEGKRYDGAWDGDQEAVAKYAIATWCQEIGWAPDLTGYDAGEVVGLGDEIPYLNAAFYDHELRDEDDVSQEVMEAVLDDVEETIVEEDMTGASREKVARGTIQRVRRRLKEDDDA